MENKRKCMVGGKLGVVINYNTHTADVYLFKEKRTSYGIHKRYVKLLPAEKKKGDQNQLTLNL